MKGQKYNLCVMGEIEMSENLFIKKSFGIKLWLRFKPSSLSPDQSLSLALGLGLSPKNVLVQLEN